MSDVTHIGLILDGNRRYAKKHNLPIKAGHKKGAEVFQECCEWLNKRGITEVSAYVLSTENLKREESQVMDLFSLFNIFFDKIVTQAIKLNVRVLFIGNKKLFSTKMQGKLTEVEEKTAHHTQNKLNLCFGYGGREELTHATQLIAQQVAKGELKPDDITQETISNALYLSSEPQLIVRTGGKSRTSNFLPWQSVYSEWIFLEKMWPEITESDIESVLAQYETIQRNFGK